jgi:hypothetical protein
MHARGGQRERLRSIDIFLYLHGSTSRRGASGPSGWKEDFAGRQSSVRDDLADLGFDSPSGEVEAICGGVAETLRFPMPKCDAVAVDPDRPPP